VDIYNRAAVSELRHIEGELKCSIHETLILLSEVSDALQRMEVAESDFAIRVDKAPDTRRKFEMGRRNRTEKEKKRRSVRD
jgi:hypothetical protein